MPGAQGYNCFTKGTFSGMIHETLFFDNIK